MWFRRRQRVAASAPLEPGGEEGVRILGPVSPDLVPAITPAVRVERYVAALAFHAAQLEDRIGHLERTVVDQADVALDRPSHGDLLEAHLHASRVSADLARLALELRAEVAEIKEEADRSARRAKRAADAAALAQDPELLVELAEELLEMADALDAKRRAS